MKVFISHSGARSRAVASALNDCLRRVIQAVKPFFSPEIEKGAKWANEIDAALEGTQFGIICLTPDNLTSTWVHYEAGALSKTGDARVWTFLHGVSNGDVPQPLGRFQHTVAERDDVLRLFKTINTRLGQFGVDPLEERLLEELFADYWPRLEEELKAAGESGDSPASDAGGDSASARGERVVLDEILEQVRYQTDRLNDLVRYPSDTPRRLYVGQPTTDGLVKKYSSVEITVFDTLPDAEKVAERVLRFFERNAIGRGEVKRTILGHVVSITFGLPMEASSIRSAISLSEDAAIVADLKWRAFESPGWYSR